MNPVEFRQQQSLALATSQIHRSRSLAELQTTFLRLAPKFVNADAFGIYLFDNKLETKAVAAHRASKSFLDEYEKIRCDDPLFSFLLENRTFTHSLAVFSQEDWLSQPLHDFLSRWGLDYSIEAPLLIDGRVCGTLNFAIGGGRYFAEESIVLAQFLCNEFNSSYQRLNELEDLRRIARPQCSLAEALEPLSPRCREVLQLLVDGLDKRAISSRLGISENTVRYHVKRLYSRFGVHNRAQLLIRLYGSRH